MRTSTSSYIVELPLRVNDQQNRFLEKAFEFGRTLYNATLGTALGRLQRMRETQRYSEHGTCCPCMPPSGQQPEADWTESPEALHRSIHPALSKFFRSHRSR